MMSYNPDLDAWSSSPPAGGRPDPFAEIEINETEPEQQGQKIAPLVLDPIREKFYAMRDIAPVNPNEWSNAKLFYRQGKFMEGFADDYEKNVHLSMYLPTYQRLGYEQLRTYFTWRTKVRQGHFPQDISLTYIFLYIYELLNGIGVDQPAEGLDKLITLLFAYKESFTAIAKRIPQWIKDYFVYYPLPFTLKEFIEKSKLEDLFSEVYLFDFEQKITLGNWLNISNYNITDTEFYQEHHEIMNIVFTKTMKALYQYSAEKGVNIADIFYLKTDIDNWRPFSGAVFYPQQRGEDKEVKISPTNVYTLRNGLWRTTMFIPFKNTGDLVAFFVKFVEIKLRAGMKQKRLPAVGVRRQESTASRFYELGLDFDLFCKTAEAIINKTYSDYIRQKNQIVVNVERKNLNRIREEAEETQEKLIVEELPEVIMPTQTTPIVAPIAAKSPWAAFKSMLIEEELNALKNPTDANNFCIQNGLMLEILADSINEKAMDTIGDNILEVTDGLEIYDEYKQDVMELLEATAGNPIPATKR